MAFHNEKLTVEKLKRLLQEITPPVELIPERLQELGRKYYSKTLTEEEIEEGRKLYEQMDANADEIYSGIFLGNGNAAQNLQFLKELGIGFVLNVAQGTRVDCVNTNEEFYAKDGVKFLGVTLIDRNWLDECSEDKHPTYQSEDINKAIQFIDEAVSISGKILVHCQGGISRSPFIVGIYLMTEKNFTIEEALRLMREKRAIFPNDGFLQELINLENKLRK